jgi:hypothetical protein
MSTIVTTSSISNTNRSSNIFNENPNEEDQLNRINLQALQNRDPYITKIVDQAQRVCVYKFIAEKREWVKREQSFILLFLLLFISRNVKNSKEHYLFTNGK